MSRLSIRCIKAAFICLALGIGLGATFAWDRSLGALLRPLHAELNLWGFVTLLIYGMGYHMLLRFTGRLLRWPGVATVQSWLALGGVALTILGRHGERTAGVKCGAVGRWCAANSRCLLVRRADRRSPPLSTGYGVVFGTRRA